MLSIHIVMVGRDKKSWISAYIAHYATLIKKYADLSLTTIPESKYYKSGEIDRALKAEGESIRSALHGGYLIVLDVRGKSLTTEELARTFLTLPNRGVSEIEFVIGGPYGLDSEVKKQASLIMSLSSLTMSHQIARLVILEQLYRVLNLNAGGSYHK